MTRHRKPARLAALLLGAASLPIGGCATTADAQTPRAASSAITQAEAQQGAKANPQLLQEFGGAMSGPQAQYVEQVGKNIAVQSGLSATRATLSPSSLLNSSVNNAFAIPGGYVYITRQLVGLMNNEAELAGVLGHEVGHVAARHSQAAAEGRDPQRPPRRARPVLRVSVLGNSAFGQFDRAEARSWARSC